ncbi:hypothetical protein FGG78_19820 [Thioclava sp. BHET1]|nr:hypothetical protein FGG78_19820 [Thioclava sp. BHET1]
MTPRSMALAYRIWGHCTPIGWNTTAAEIADALGEPVGAVRRICAMKNWTWRLRAVRPRASDQQYIPPGPEELRFEELASGVEPHA